MSGSVYVDSPRLEIAFSEIEAIRNLLPESALAALALEVVALEVVARVANNLRDLPATETAPTSEEIDDLCAALLSPDRQALIAQVVRARKNGASSETLCLGYLAEAARRLGEWWDSDRVPFQDVTVAAGRICALLRILRLERMTPLPDLRRAAIFAAVPGENHTPGITMAADLARDQGWDIEVFVGRSHEDLIHDFDRRTATLIGLSASGRRSLPALIKLIVALRISRPRALILVSGNIAAGSFNLVGRTGDAAADFNTALAEMERLAILSAARPV